MQLRDLKSARGQNNREYPTLVWVLGFTVLLSAVTLTAHSGSTSTAARVLADHDEQLTQYRALRRMHAKSDRFNQEGWVDAWTEFDQHGFRYRIMSERGSDYVRNKVLKAVLKREQELIDNGHADRAALTEDNYVFTDDDTPRGGLRYVLMKPRRKEVTLVDGRMVLSADGSDLLRIEGRLAKNPSFWTSLVNVIRHFAKVEGVRVPVATESVAKVKFAGQSHLNVVYEYESINGRPVSTAARRVLAAASRTSLPE
jgi:hypothetical protein